MELSNFGGMLEPLRIFGHRNDEGIASFYEAWWETHSGRGSWAKVDHQKDRPGYQDQRGDEHLLALGLL